MKSNKYEKIAAFNLCLQKHSAHTQQILIKAQH